MSSPLIRALRDVRAADLSIVGGKGASLGELPAKGRIASPDDMWFLSVPELRRAIGGEDTREVVAVRRAEYQRELRRRRVPRILLSDGTEAEVAFAPPIPDGAIRGAAASPGPPEASRASSAHRRARSSSRARCSSRPPPTRGGRRSSSRRARS